MDEIQTLLAQLQRSNVRLWCEDGRLRYSAAQGAMTPDLLASIRARKADILAFLENRSGPLRRIPTLRIQPESQVLPVTYAQHQWCEYEDLELPVPYINTAYEFEGPLNVAALQESFAELFRRHSVLRTRYEKRNGEHVQIIAPFDGFSLPMIDLSHVEASQQVVAVQQAALEEGLQPMPLSAGGLLRARLFRLSPTRHVLFSMMHHVISDAVSTALYAREVKQLYAAFAYGQAAPPPPAAQYSDFTLWQHEWLGGDEEYIGYWNRRLSGLRPVQLYAGAPGWQPRARSDFIDFVLAEGATLAALKLLAQQQDCSVAALMLTAWDMLLSNYCECEEIGFPVPFHGRVTPQLLEMTGVVMLTQMMRIDSSGDPSYLELLARVREEMAQARAHYGVPPLTALKLPPGMRLLQQQANIGFNYILPPPGAAAAIAGEVSSVLSERPFTLLRPRRSNSFYDLQFTVTEGADRLSAQVWYDTLRSADWQAQQLAQGMRTMMDLIVSAPTMKLSRLRGRLPRLR